MKNIFIVTAFCLAASLLTCPARAAAVYTYTGNDFSVCSTGQSSCTPIGHISGSFTLSSALAANMPLTPISPQGFSFTDNETAVGPTGITVTSSNQQSGIIFSVATDATGNVSAWDISVQSANSSGDVFALATADFVSSGQPTVIDFNNFINNSFPIFPFNSESVTNDPGIWACTGACTPTTTSTPPTSTTPPASTTPTSTAGPSGYPYFPVICAGDIAICHIPAALCVEPCRNLVIYWRPPNVDQGDPWLKQTAVYASGVSIEQTESFAADLQVAVSTEPIEQQVSARIARANPPGNDGTPGLHSGAAIGTIVDISIIAKSGAVPPLQHAADSARGPVFVVSVPYNAAKLPTGARPKLAEYDRRTGRWLDVGIQSVDTSKHVVTARVTSVGKFTVVASAPPSH